MPSEMRRQRSLLPLIIVVLAVGAAMLPIAAGYVQHYALSFSAAFGIYICFIELLLYVAAPAFPAGHTLLARIMSGRYKTFKLLLLLTLPYLCYTAGTGDWQWTGMLRVVGIAAPVIIVYSAFPVASAATFTVQDLFAAAWMVSVVLFHLFQGVWNRPANLDFMGRFFVLSLGVLCWTHIRCVPDLGYRLVFSTTVFVSVVKNFCLFAVIAIPLGIALGFTSWNPRWRGALDFATAFLQIFLFIALLEEVFFRGFLQNLLEKSFHSWWRAQLVASCIFGLFHILHAPFPNWRYVVLASVAGWFYGAAYREGGTLFASALVHATVDTTWRTFFTRS